MTENTGHVFPFFGTTSYRNPMDMDPFLKVVVFMYFVRNTQSVLKAQHQPYPSTPYPFADVPGALVLQCAVHEQNIAQELSNALSLMDPFFVQRALASLECQSTRVPEYCSTKVLQY
jgi:hypothetical protein